MDQHSTQERFLADNLNMDQHSTQERFLADNPNIEECWQALRLNVQTCYERVARADGEEIFREAGIMCVQGHMTISAFDVQEIGVQVERALTWYRNSQPTCGAICWYLTPEPPVGLDARLFARGIEQNWQPHWMWCELQDLSDDFVYPDTFEIHVVEDATGQPVDDDLPNYNARDAAKLTTVHNAYPAYVWQLVALQEKQLVGHCMLNITTGERGVAGLFNMGVVPAARHRGIGTSLTRAACELAREKGCRHVVLNATEMGEPIYRKVGFQSIGYGHSWYLNPQTLTRPVPSRDEVTFLEAVGLGDVATLDEVGQRLAPALFNEPSLNHMTPLDIAVSCRQPESAMWLVEHGARLDLVSAWDLGWKEQIPTLLAEHPELVNLQRGESQVTPLHIAIERNDIELAKLLFTFPVDLTIKDREFESTPIGWAHFFQRKEIIALIKHSYTDTD